FYAPELKRLAARQVAEADWFHGHGFYVWLNAWLGGEARRRKKPLVYHPQGFLDPWILARSRKKKRMAHWLFEDRNFSYVQWWRAVSAKEADQIRAYGITAPVHVIPNGVDIAECDATRAPDAFADCPWACRKRPKRVLFLSRIHKKKGLDLLVPAWGRLTREFPDWELVIVGPDEGGYQAIVEGLIRSQGCGGTCTVCPAVSGAEKHALLDTADLFVLPSYSEGFPMAVLEAAAHRLPVVMTDECNFPELATAGGAWECTAGLESLTAAMREALSCDETERVERGRRGRELVAAKYSWDQAACALRAQC
ncbi:MAG: glycosyltransferase, partial [Verrucomicrobiae bacterium]